MTPTCRRLRLPVLALSLVLGACRDKSEERTLETELSKVYGSAFATLDTTGVPTLRVTFLSSPFAEWSAAERRPTARKVAGVVRDRYPRYKALDRVVVDFPTKKELAADTLGHIAASDTFTRAELGPPRP